MRLVSYSASWLFQKILAIIFLIALIYIIYSLSFVDLKNYNSLSLWFNNIINIITTKILFVSILIHSNIGLSSIIDDYFHKREIKNKIILLKNFFLSSSFFMVIYSLVTIIF